MERAYEFDPHLLLCLGAGEAEEECDEEDELDEDREYDADDPLLEPELLRLELPEELTWKGEIIFHNRSLALLQSFSQSAG